MDTDNARAIGRIAKHAAAAGADTAALRAVPMEDGQPDYAEALPALSDLADTLSGAGARVDVLTDVVTLLQRLRSAENGGPRETREGADGLPRELFADLRADYIKLFSTCTVRPERADLVAWHVRKLIAGRPTYERVGQRLAVPWYFVGIAHGLEAGFRFDCHLHNGDPLSARTVQVPKGRPQVWNPPNDWDSSAVDALTMEGFADRPDWDLPHTLYRWEAYNGFGSRRQGINSPYLWSFSNLYDKGKYVRDKVWDPNAVSKQCGAALMLKALVNAGQVPVPADH